MFAKIWNEVISLSLQNIVNGFCCIFGAFSGVVKLYVSCLSQNIVVSFKTHFEDFHQSIHVRAQTSKSVQQAFPIQPPLVTCHWKNHLSFAQVWIDGTRVTCPASPGSRCVHACVVAMRMRVQAAPLPIPRRGYPCIPPLRRIRLIRMRSVHPLSHIILLYYEHTPTSSKPSNRHPSKVRGKKSAHKRRGVPRCHS